MHGTIWITPPVARVFGDEAMAQQPAPEHAHGFQLTQCTGELVIAGQYMMDIDEDTIADELFKCAALVLTEDKDAEATEDLVLHFAGKTIAHGACATTEYISDDALFHNEQNVYH